MIDVSKIQTISIDFWNTLVDGSNTNERKMQRLDATFQILNPYASDITSFRIEEVIKLGIQYFNVVWENEHRTLSSTEIISHLLNELKLSISTADRNKLLKIFENGILLFPPALAPDAQIVIPKLSKKYKLGIISDTHFSPGKVIKQLLQQLGLLTSFSSFAFSDEMGVSKPHHKMFEKIMQDTNSTQTTTCHIGDMVRTDISGAKAMGIKSILFTGINSHDEASQLPDIKLTSWHDIGNLFLK